MPQLIPYRDYSRREVQEIFDPEAKFTPGAGTWGLHGIVRLPGRRHDYVFFVTFGQRQADHEFDEGITSDGVFRWQSQPSQRLADSMIKEFIAHDDTKNSIYLFLRTAETRAGMLVPYTYLGRLRYLSHDRDREQPVYFTWQILNWSLPEEIRAGIYLTYESEPFSPAYVKSPDTLVKVAVPTSSVSHVGLKTAEYIARPQHDYAEQDARNRRLGLGGEEAVLQREKTTLQAAGRNDSAEMVTHVAKVEGDGAGYDIKSYSLNGEQIFIEVKTTRGGVQTPFYLSRLEAGFSKDHADCYYLYRVFEFDEDASSGKYFVTKGDLFVNFCLEPLQFKAVLGTQSQPQGV
jgi:hypothetical protein